MTVALQHIKQACLTGLGPPNQGEALPFICFTELPDSDDSWTRFGYLGPKRAMIVGAHWMMSETELLSLCVRDVRKMVAPNGRLMVAARLPSSKNDVHVLGEARFLC